MKDWFDSLQYREQIFVGTGAIVVVLALMWGLLWLPLDNSHKELRLKVNNWQQSLDELRPISALPGRAVGLLRTRGPVGLIAEAQRYIVWRLCPA